MASEIDAIKAELDKLRERLEEYAPDEMQIVYSVLEGPLPVKNIRTGMRLRPITDTHGTHSGQKPVKQGGQQIRNSSLHGDVVSIFVLPPSMAELEQRLRGRGQDSETVIADRMAKSRDEISHWAEYDYVLVNHEVEATFAHLAAIVTAERLRRVRQPGLSAFVRTLNEEFAAR